MMFFKKSLLCIAATALIFSMASLAVGAEDRGDAMARLDRLDGQIAAARGQILIAQGYGRPPGDIGDAGEATYAGAGDLQDGAQLTVRIDRLENQMRQINGQIEQMQFETRRLGDQLKKFQEDVDFRFRDSGTPGAAPAGKPLQRRSEAVPETPAEPDSRAPAQGPAAAPSRASGRGDAFDPSQNPAAPGVPRQLGSPAPVAAAASSGLAHGPLGQSGPPGLDQTDPDAPLDLSNGRSRVPPAMPPAPPAASASITTPGGTVIAAAPSNPAKEEFDIALGYYKQKAYENAEKGFAAFLEKNPKNKMAPDAIYYLGESFYQRGRQREAAEQYLKISTQYASSSHAPEAMLRLGQSLNALGAKEQACATYGEIARKYPNASATVKTGAEREAKRAQC